MTIEQSKSDLNQFLIRTKSLWCRDSKLRERFGSIDNLDFERFIEIEGVLYF